LRFGSNRTVFFRYFIGVRKLEISKEDHALEIKQAELKAKASLDFIESRVKERPFIVSDQNPTLADVSAVCDIA
jgi:glutathione S-transferase